MRLAIVVQRYGRRYQRRRRAARPYIAERLSARTEVRVLRPARETNLTWRTSCAGTDEINGFRSSGFGSHASAGVREFGVR